MAIRLLFIILIGCGKSSLLSLLFDERETWMQPKENCSTCYRSFCGGHGGLGIKTVAELVESNYFSNANDTHITNWSAYPGNIKD